MYEQAKEVLAEAPASGLKTRLNFHLAHKLGDESALMDHHQLAPNRPYIYDPLSFQKQNSLELPKSQPSNGFPNQLISLHQIRNYQPNSSLMEHSILGGLKDK